MIDLSIIIPTKSRKDVFFETFNAIQSLQASVVYEVIIIIDDDRNTYSYLLQNGNSKIKVFLNPGIGVSAARNYGAEMAKGRILLFIDNDMLISKLDLSEVIGFFNQFKSAILVPNWIHSLQVYDLKKNTFFGKYVYAYNGDDSLERRMALENVQWRNDKLFESYCSGIPECCFAIERTSFLNVGGFNESLKFNEGRDLWAKLKERGCRMFVNPKEIVYHNEFDRYSKPAVFLNGLWRKGFDEGLQNGQKLNSINIMLLVFKIRFVISLLLSVMGGVKFGFPVYKKLMGLLAIAYYCRGYQTALYKLNQKQLLH